MKKTRWVAFLLVLCAVLSGMTACNSQNKSAENENTSAVTIIEPGAHTAGDESSPTATETQSSNDAAVSEQLSEPEHEEDDAVNAALASLQATQSQIESFYFEQNVNYPDGLVFLQVWYKDDKMKLVSSVDGYGLTENYYDYQDGTVINSTPGSTEPAMIMDFDPNGDDAPDNPLRENYSSYNLVGNETIDHYPCLLLETPAGDLLWVSTENGFPVQVTFTDSLGNLLTTKYSNVKINTVQSDDVTPPDQLEVYYYGD